MDHISIIHFADMHLGKVISAFDKSKNRIRMQEMEQSCLSAMNMADGCHIALLSGDIFDFPDVSEKICKSVIDKISSMPDVRFFYSCGNHDPYISKSTDFLVRNCPDNLHIFGYEDVECVTIESLRTKVYGISFADRYMMQSPLNDIGACDPSYINIMCIHGEIAEKSVYNPLDMDLFEKKGFDYVALGHTHNFDGIKRANKMLYAYPGCIEPSGFDECGRKGYIKGKIKKGESDLGFVESNKRQYHSIAVDITQFYDYYEVIDKITKTVDASDDLWRISLQGENHLGSLIDVELIKNRVNAFYIEIQNDTKIPYNINQESESFSLLGLCAKETLKLINDESDETKIKIYEDAFSILYGLLSKGGEK